MAQENRRTRRADTRPLSIGALARATRIPVETLRTWERRYGAPKPERKPSGHRVYPARTVEHLRRVQRLLAQGYRPGEILVRSVSELDALIALSAPVAGPAGRDPAPAAGLPRGEAVAALLEATAGFDRGAIVRALQDGWVRLGPLRLLEEVAGPFMVEVGRGWKTGTLEVRHEHFASACLGDFLRAAREPFDREARGARVVAATLPGDAHESGLQMACAVLALRGFRVVYLGASTPVEQTGEAARAVHAEAVAVSVSASLARARSKAGLGRLRDTLPRGLALWVGGAGAPPPPAGVERFATLSEFDARIAGGG